MSSTPLRPGAVAIPAVAAAVLYSNPHWTRANASEHRELAADPSKSRARAASHDRFESPDLPAKDR